VHRECVTIIGAGFIGQHLVRECLAAGLRVAVLDKHPCPAQFLDRVRWVSGNASDLDCLTSAVKGSSVVYHMVGGIRADQAKQDTNDCIELGLKLTADIVACCTALLVRRIVMTSSAAVYGAQRIAKIGESATVAPLSTYGRHKLMHEQALIEACDRVGLEKCIVRLANPFGIALNSTKQDGLVPILLESVRLRRPFYLHGDGTATRDFIWLTDVTRALLLCGVRQAIPKVVNIGSGQGTTVNQLIQLVESLSGKRVDVRYLTKSLVEIDYSVLDIKLAKEMLGFNPEINLEEGLRALLANNKLV
jgi:UDP-glucose 4-epimerase